MCWSIPWCRAAKINARAPDPLCRIDIEISLTEDHPADGLLSRSIGRRRPANAPTNGRLPTQPVRSTRLTLLANPATSSSSLPPSVDPWRHFPARKLVIPSGIPGESWPCLPPVVAIAFQCDRIPQLLHRWIPPKMVSVVWHRKTGVRYTRHGRIWTNVMAGGVKPAALKVLAQRIPRFARDDRPWQSTSPAFRPSYAFMAKIGPENR